MKQAERELMVEALAASAMSNAAGTVWVVPSKTEAGVWYAVTIGQEPGDAACTCPYVRGGFPLGPAKSYGQCTHIEAVAKRQRQDRVTTDPLPIAQVPPVTGDMIKQALSAVYRCIPSPHNKLLVDELAKGVWSVGLPLPFHLALIAAIGRTNRTPWKEFELDG